MKQLAVEVVGHLYFFISQKPPDSFLRAFSLSVVFLVVQYETKRIRGEYEASAYICQLIHF